MSAPDDAPSKQSPSSMDDGQMDPRSRVDDRLKAARGCLRVERRILSDERAAFRSFGDRLLALDAPVRTATIESHYRETVMAVPHYRSEYGDTFAQSVAAEFGSTIAFDCTCDRRLEAPAVGAIRDATRRCWRARDELVDRIDAERHAVATAADALEKLWDSLESLDDSAGEENGARLRLAVLRERCDALARRRRATLGGDGRDSDEGRTPAENQPADGEAGPPPGCEERIVDGDLRSLCYRDLDADRPVLAAIDELRRAIERRRRTTIGRGADDQ
ncbi:hypothetical protein GCM10028857_23750 [Salinarchaeum chitinilyticum]